MFKISTQLRREGATAFISFYQNVNLSCGDEDRDP